MTNLFKSLFEQQQKQNLQQIQPTLIPDAQIHVPQYDFHRFDKSKAAAILLGVKLQLDSKTYDN